MNNIRTFLEKIVRVRRAHINRYRGAIDNRLIGHLDRLELEMRIPDCRLLDYARRNRDTIYLLIPGGKHPHAERWRNEFDSLLA